MVQYFGTRRVRTSAAQRSGATVLYVDKEWGFVKGDDVMVTLRRLGQPPEADVRLPRVIVGAGNSFRFTIPKTLGYDYDDWIVFSVEKMSDVTKRIDALEQERANNDLETLKRDMKRK